MSQLVLVSLFELVLVSLFELELKELLSMLELGLRLIRVLKLESE